MLDTTCTNGDGSFFYNLIPFNKMYNNYKNLHYLRLFLGILLFFLILVIPISALYLNESVETVTVISITEQQKVWDTGDGITTTYHYLVTTDKGVYEITPSGIFHSNAFGNLHPNKSYRIQTRGIREPLFNLYPYIINATELN